MLTITGLIATLLFLTGWYTVAALSCLFVTQVWRVFSEFLRADNRGSLKFTAYQRIALAACAVALCLALLLPAPAARPTSIASGLGTLWTPAVIIGLQALWLASFLFTGRSEVTQSTVHFHLRRERV